jgi:ketosteroid isomerase-like protein
MTAENESLVRDAFGALARGDLASLLQMVDPEFEWTFLDPSVENPEPQVCRGPPELARVLRHGAGQPARELEEIVPYGDRVFVVTRLVTEGESGGSTAPKSFHVVTVHDGRIIALRACRTKGEALVLATGS